MCPDYYFPLSGASEFVERIAAPPPDAHVHRWVLRDDNERHCHGRLRLEEDPVHLELRWRPNSRGQEQRVGIFRLHLSRLAAEGYVRPEGDGTKGDEIRLRFYRGERGVVYIQSREDLPRLAIGVVDVTLD